MNYNSMQELLDAGTTNMETIRKNSYDDSSTFTVKGVDWFTYNGTVVNNVYVNSNSWFGFGANTTHLCVNHQDASNFDIYREEGTLHNYYKFLKIRWRGYSYWNQHYDTYLQEYDVILWDTGDISLHMVTVPVNSWGATFQLNTNITHTYTKPTANSPDVTFHPGNSSNTYEIAYQLLELLPPFDRRHLIRSDGVLYTVVDGALSALTETEVTSAMFANYGVENAPDGSLLLGLHSPELLYWQDSDLDIATKTFIVTATPPPQVIVSNRVDLTHKTITGIESAVVTCEGSPLFCVSFDNKQTWKAWNGVEWSTVSEEYSGMTRELFESINYDIWLPLYQDADSFYIKVILNENELTQSITQIYVDFAN